jgi:hypothetical protein
MKVLRVAEYVIERFPDGSVASMAWRGTKIVRHKTKKDRIDQCRRILERVPPSELSKPRYVRVYRQWKIALGG